MAAAICSPSPKSDGGKADYTNERVRVFFILLSCVGGGLGVWWGAGNEEGGSLKFKHIIPRRSLGALVSRSPSRTAANSSQK